MDERLAFLIVVLAIVYLVFGFGVATNQTRMAGPRKPSPFLKETYFIFEDGLITIVSAVIWLPLTVIYYLVWVLRKIFSLPKKIWRLIWKKVRNNQLAGDKQ